MKKIIALSLLLLTAAAFVPSIEAKSSGVSNLTAGSAAASPSYAQVYQNRRNNRRTVRIVTRNVRRGRQIYRETYRVTYNNRNGRTTTQLISRVRIGRY